MMCDAVFCLTWCDVPFPDMQFSHHPTGSGLWSFVADRLFRFVFLTHRIYNTKFPRARWSDFPTGYCRSSDSRWSFDGSRLGCRFSRLIARRCHNGSADCRFG